MPKLTRTTFITNELKLTNTNIPLGQYQFSPKLTRKIGKIDQESFYTDLILIVENTSEKPFPLNIKIDFRAIFEFEEIKNLSEIDSFLKVQAVHIMFPYLRAMLSNLTNTAMMPPLILPIIDASQIFKDCDENVKIN